VRTRTRTAIGTLAALALLAPFVVPRGISAPADRGDRTRMVRSTAHLLQAYRRWQTVKAGADSVDKLTLGLGWSKAFSAEHTQTRGLLTLDLRHGTALAEVEDLDDPDGADLWLVDNLPGGSTLPERGDAMVRLGRLVPERGVARLDVRLPAGLLRTFEVDLAVLTRAGVAPTRPALLYGHATLFQKLHVRAVLGRPAGAQPEGVIPLPTARGLLPAAALDSGPAAALSSLAEIGEDLFFNETFAGNGRTCGTCHPAENNFTLDPKFIARLPADDPLFVSEHNPALAELERPALLRALGLIVVNPDGFDDPTRKFVMRAATQTLALGLSLDPAPIDPFTGERVDESTVPPLQRTGWSGDGAPGSGTLLEFALGAIKQHATRTLARVPGVDFRVPTTEELEALEAFQLSLGRQEDLNFFTLQLRDPVAAEGKAIFSNNGANPNVAVGKCIQCHINAGAQQFIFLPPADIVGFNGVFDTGSERVPNQPARRIDPTLPRDGGFGTEEDCDLDGDGAPDPGVFGNCAFNVPSVVEAADTAPFFHNHARRTLEEAIAVYSEDEFNTSGASEQIGEIHLTAEENAKIAAFLRVINALENIRQARERQDAALNAPRRRARTLLALAAGETRDGIEVLAQSHLHPDVIARLFLAERILELGADGAIPVATAVSQAARLQEKARATMVIDPVQP
jgi:cytochrome c peroxidase